MTFMSVLKLPILPNEEEDNDAATACESVWGADTTHKEEDNDSILNAWDPPCAPSPNVSCGKCGSTKHIAKNCDHPDNLHA